MVKRFKCEKCGNEVLDIVKDENGVDLCWNCVRNIDETDFVDFDIELGKLMFRASSVQKMGNRYMLEIPKGSSAEMKILKMGEHIRTGYWKVFAVSYAHGEE